MSSLEARRLRGLPTIWEAPIVESGIEALEERANALVAALMKRGRRREADELRRVRALLERVDDLHSHAENLETLTGLYRALLVFAGDRDPALESSLAWAQVGSPVDDASVVGHGPAFR